VSALNFTSLIDVACEKLGGTVLSASDEFFAEKENLILPGRGIFIPGKYTDRGKWMDGWESRRKRVAGNDWCILKLAVPAVISGVDIDTNHFLGNHPPYASVEGLAQGQSPDQDNQNWQSLLDKSVLKPGSQNLFPTTQAKAVSFIKLSIYPDGGVARFRAYGIAKPNWADLMPLGPIDLAAAKNGGVVLECNDMFFSPKDNLIMPGRSTNMGDGWETRRRRNPGNDWLILQLAKPAKIERIEIDTDHYKGNYPDACSIEGCLSERTFGDFAKDAVSWLKIQEKTKLNADFRHIFVDELASHSLVSHIRLNIFPDGGIARLRIFGEAI
jgi:allantoicase